MEQEAQAHVSLASSSKAGVEQKLQAGLEQAKLSLKQGSSQAELEQKLHAGLEEAMLSVNEGSSKVELEQKLREGLESAKESSMEQEAQAHVSLASSSKAGVEQ